jgi:hypothetical protein
MKHIFEFESYGGTSYLKNISDSDIIASTLVGEAGGEKKEGMTAVYSVLKNREKKKGTSKAGEALRPGQFDIWKKAWPGVKVKADYDLNKINSIIAIYKNRKEWEKSWEIAKEIIKEDPEDITGGASHYYAQNKMSLPSVFKGFQLTKVIGGHTFGNGVKY